MATQLKDILTWIESPVNFESGIGKLESDDQIKRMRLLLNQVLEKSSEGWVRMNTDQLEKTLTSLHNLEDKCKKLADRFYFDIGFYEDGLYEVITPHEWEAMPPKDGNPEVIETAIKKYYEQQQKIVAKTKANFNEIFFNTSGYSRIANTWHEELVRRIASIKRLITKKNLVGSEEKVADVAEDGSIPIPSLKPKKGLDYYSGLPKLRAELIKYELISPEVELPEIRGLFSFNEMSIRFPWKGPRVALRQFIQDLLKYEKIEDFPGRKKWETVAKIFIIEDEPNKDIGSLKGDNDIYKFQKELRSLVQNL